MRSQRTQRGGARSRAPARAPPANNVYICNNLGYRTAPRPGALHMHFCLLQGVSTAFFKTRIFSVTSARRPHCRGRKDLIDFHLIECIICGIQDRAIALKTSQSSHKGTTRTTTSSFDSCAGRRVEDYSVKPFAYRMEDRVSARAQPNNIWSLLWGSLTHRGTSADVSAAQDGTKSRRRTGLRRTPPAAARASLIITLYRGTSGRAPILFGEFRSRLTSAGRARRGAPTPRERRVFAHLGLLFLIRNSAVAVPMRAR
ncbi:hypothetical protein EVAR_40844_1 [Eumeta japonica]|uniref:Uncharacterized protein n=1 Tax=Eumeta variegata TaxID=151549 RepID=A0A4C1ZSL5_EUMVA|nr:hypothetical protein EVAR_40844_1 [Eumeta japonica]